MEKEQICQNIYVSRKTGINEVDVYSSQILSKTNGGEKSLKMSRTIGTVNLGIKIFVVSEVNKKGRKLTFLEIF